MRVAPIGAAFLASLVATAWSALTFVLTPLFLLAVLGTFVPVPAAQACVQSAYRRVTRFIQWAWTGHVAMLLECAYGMQVKIYGDAATKARESEMLNERALWIANHRTRIDWMLMWSVALRTGTLASLRIILKAPLRKIPIFGWAMQHFIFVFLQRRATDDQEHVERLLPFLARAEPDASYLLFPEGTDLSESNVEKSVKYAEKLQLPTRKYSLYPRTTGWTFMFPLLKQSVRAVYDVTMFYVDYTPDERPSEVSLVTGRMPRTVHFYLERIDIEDVAKLDESALAKWLEARFERKEALLKGFYEDKNLPSGAEPMFESDVRPTIAVLLAFWVVLILAAFKFALAIGAVWSLVGVFAVVAGYAVFTAAGPGVDGFLLANM